MVECGGVNLDCEVVGAGGGCGDVFDLEAGEALDGIGMLC